MFEIFKDFGFVIIQLITVGVIIVVKFNDIHHLKVGIKEELEKIWKKLESVDAETRRQGERLARLESRVFKGGK